MYSVVVVGGGMIGSSAAKYIAQMSDGTDGRVDQLVFGPNNLSLIGTTSSDELIIWNVLTGEVELKTTCSSGFKGLSFYNDGNNVIYIDQNSKLSSINVKTKELVPLNSDIYVTSMVIDDIRNVAYIFGLKGELVYFDLKTNSVVKTVQIFDKVNFTYTPARISKNGKYIVNTFSDDKLRVFDTEEAQFVYVSKKYDARVMTFEMDAKDPVVYFTLHTGEVIFFDYLKEKIIHSFKDDSYIANCMTTYPEGQVLILANYNVIRFIDTKSKKTFKTLKPKINKVLNMAYDQQGKFLAVASDKVNIQIWDLRRNKIVKTLQGFFPCEFSPDGSELITMSYTTNMAVWDVETWEKKQELKTEYELIQKIAFSPNGKYVAGSGYNQIIKIWDRETGKLIKKLKGHTAGILALSFHPTQPILASGSHDQTVRIWEFLKEKEIKQFTDQTVIVSEVKFSPDGKTLASSAWDKTIYLRDTETWSTKKVLNP